MKRNLCIMLNVVERKGLLHLNHRQAKYVSEIPEKVEKWEQHKEEKRALSNLYSKDGSFDI